MNLFFKYFANINIIFFLVGILCSMHPADTKVNRNYNDLIDSENDKGYCSNLYEYYCTNLASDQEKMQLSGNVDSNFKQELKRNVFPKIKEFVIDELKILSLPEEQIHIFSELVEDTSFSFRDDECDVNIKGFWSRKIYICESNLYSSENIMYLIRLAAHELSHSFTPCNTDNGEWDEDLVMNDLDNKLRKNPEIGARRNNCLLDRTIEAIPDLIAKEVLKRYIKTYPEKFQHLNKPKAIATLHTESCRYSKEEIYKLSDPFRYPSPYWRLNEVFGQDPFFRKYLSCD